MPERPSPTRRRSLATFSLYFPLLVTLEFTDKHRLALLDFCCDPFDAFTRSHVANLTNSQSITTGVSFPAVACGILVSIPQFHSTVTTSCIPETRSHPGLQLAKAASHERMLRCCLPDLLLWRTQICGQDVPSKSDHGSESRNPLMVAVAPVNYHYL